MHDPLMEYRQPEAPLDQDLAAKLAEAERPKVPGQRVILNEYILEIKKTAKISKLLLHICNKIGLWDKHNKISKEMKYGGWKV